ncbi:MAG: sigma factor, partial [Elusimicrobiota bacterium]
MKKRPFFRFLSTTLAIIYLATNCVFASQPEVNLWEERRRASTVKKPDFKLAQLPKNQLVNSAQILNQLPRAKPFFPEQIQKSVPSYLAPQLSSLFQNLPPKYGTIRKVVLPSPHWGEGQGEGKIVIHIQDIHLNSEAQNNIAGAVQSLIDSKQVGLIALEGAFAPIDLTSFRTFPHQEVVRDVADYLLKENKISGPLHAAFTSKNGIPPIVGVDDEIHYHANVDAYRESTSLVLSAKEKLKKWQDDLNMKKSKNFNSELISFDQEVHAYHQGTVSIGAYAQLLSKKIDNPAAEIASFLEALHLESRLQFSLVERERAALLNKLLPVLRKDETSNLINVSIAYRTGNLGHTDFYVYLKDLCQKNGIILSQFPEMNSYLKYILLSERIEAEKLLSDLNKVEGQIYSSLVKTETEKTLISESKRFFLTHKLIDFSLTKDEWEQYKHDRSLMLLAGINLKPFENFYEEAQARDQAMSSNLIKAMNQHKAKVAVLVTGGFHASGISDQSRLSGLTTVSYVPKMTKVDTENGSSYLSAFTQEKTPLDKLFEGQKLFLSQEVMPLKVRYLSGVLTILRTLWLRLGSTDDKSIKEQLSLLTGQPADQVSFSIKNGTAVMNDKGIRIIVQQTEQKINSIKQETSFFWTPFREFKETFAIALGKIDPLKFVMDHPQSENLNITLMRLLGLRVMVYMTRAGLLILPILVGLALLSGATWCSLLFFLFRIKDFDKRVAHIISHWVQMALFPEARLTKSKARGGKSKEMDVNFPVVSPYFELERRYGALWNSLDKNRKDWTKEWNKDLRIIDWGNSELARFSGNRSEWQGRVTLELTKEDKTKLIQTITSILKNLRKNQKDSHYQYFLSKDEETIVMQAIFSKGITENQRDFLTHLLVILNYGLARDAADKISSPNNVSDAFQEACLAMFTKAVPQFKIKENTRFSTYATWWLRQAIINFNRKNNDVEIPSYVTDRYNKISRLRFFLAHNLNRKPTDWELCLYNNRLVLEELCPDQEWSDKEIESVSHTGTWKGLEFKKEPSQEIRAKLGHLLWNEKKIREAINSREGILHLNDTKEDGNGGAQNEIPIKGPSS